MNTHSNAIVILGYPLSVRIIGKQKYIVFMGGDLHFPDTAGVLPLGEYQEIALDCKLRRDENENEIIEVLKLKKATEKNGV
jgi:hypothetical protein